MQVGQRVQHVSGRSDLHGEIVALTRDDFGNRRLIVDLDKGHRNVVYSECMMEPEFDTESTNS